MENGITKEQQRQEAIIRLRVLEEKGLMPQVRKDFEQGTLSYSERMTIPGFGTNGILYWLNQNAEFEKIVRDFEERTDSVVYHATHEVFEGIGRILDLFYVSKYEEEWPQDRVDLEGGRGVFLGPLFVDAKQKNCQESGPRRHHCYPASRWPNVSGIKSELNYTTLFKPKATVHHDVRTPLEHRGAWQVSCAA